MGKNKSKKKPKTEFQKFRSFDAKLDNYLAKQKEIIKKEIEEKAKIEGEKEYE